jgi:hypothetical protein
VFWWRGPRPAGERVHPTARHRRVRKWYLGIDGQEDPDNKGRYKFPYSDFDKVHRCGLLAAESRAGQRKYYDIELAVAHLHGMLEALRLAADHSTRRIRGHQTSQS